MTNSTNKYYLKTYGCQMNLADSERIAGWYEEKGWRKAKKIEEADEIVIVSCSVRQSADNRVFGLVNNLIKLKAKSAERKTKVQNLKLLKPRIVLTGCMLRYPKDWLKKKLTAVDEFKRISEYSLNTKYPPAPRLRRAGIIHNTKQAALVPIMEGCNNFCTYCVVPYARGRELSRSFEEIVCEVEELAKRGYKEITLLGQNVNSYGREAQKQSPVPSGTGQSSKEAKKNNSETMQLCVFASLLYHLHKINGIKKISFLTSNPWDLTDDIIEAMSLPKIDRYLHLPVQSGDDGILKKMNRKYSVKQYVGLVGKIRKRIPDIQIGTDIIVGFPGETEEQFQKTVDLCKKLCFTKAYIARYSPRLQTAAYKFKDDVPYKEKKRRWQILEELINGNS